MTYVGASSEKRVLYGHTQSSRSKVVLSRGKRVQPNGSRGTATTGRGKKKKKKKKKKKYSDKRNQTESDLESDLISRRSRTIGESDDTTIT